LKSKKILIPFLILIISPVCIYALLYICISFYSHSKLEKLLSDAKSRGEIISLSEIKKDKISSEENRADFYIKAFNLVNTKYDRCEYGLSMKLILRFYSDNKSDVISELEKNRNVVIIMDEAFDKKGCDFRFEYEKGFKRQTPFKIPRVRPVVYMLIFQALQDIEKKDNHMAVKRIEQCLKLSDDLSENHILMTEFLAIAVGHISLNFTDYILKNNVIADYNPLLDDIKKLKWKIQKDFIKSVEVERATGILCYDEFLARPGRSIFLFKPYFLMDKLFYLNVMTERLNMIHNNTYKEKHEEFEHQVREKLPYYTFAPLVLPEFYKGYITNMELVSKCDEIIQKLEVISENN
jgi:hypothetical protein